MAARLRSNALSATKGHLPMPAIRRLLFLVATVSLGGCATEPPAQQVADATPKKEKCVVVTGTSVCRKDGTGQIANVVSVPGKALLKKPGEIMESAPTKTGD